MSNSSVKYLNIIVLTYDNNLAFNKCKHEIIGTHLNWINLKHYQNYSQIDHPQNIFWVDIIMLINIIGKVTYFVYFNYIEALSTDLNPISW